MVRVLLQVPRAPSREFWCVLCPPDLSMCRCFSLPLFGGHPSTPLHNAARSELGTRPEHFSCLESK